MIVTKVDRRFLKNANAAVVRHQSVKVAAYLKAERAGFPAGQEVRFWAEAEREHDERYKKLMADKSLWERFMCKIGIHG
jgi:hypothetical protein